MVFIMVTTVKSNRLVSLIGHLKMGDMSRVGRLPWKTPLTGE